MTIYGPDPHAALNDFEDKPLVLVILGENATVKVWLSDVIKTPAQHDWAMEQYRSALALLIDLQGSVANQ